MPVVAGPFDRILIHARLDTPPPQLVELLAEDGRLIMARPDAQVAWRQMLVELRRDREGEIIETELGACRLQALLSGTAKVL